MNTKFNLYTHYLLWAMNHAVKGINNQDDINCFIADMQEQNTMVKGVFMSAILRNKKTMKVARLNKNFIQFVSDAWEGFTNETK